jgi:hypothetical protein
MIRRDPTRIELKLDDIQEFERRKQDLEAERIKAGHVLPLAQNHQKQSAEIDDPKKTRSEMIHARIGFDPTPKIN